MDHAWLLDMLRVRIEDRALLKLIRKWLKAGVLETDGQVVHPETGTPQGGTSPFAQSISNFLNFKLPVESGTQPLSLQDILLQPRQRCEPTQDFLSGSILYDGERQIRKRLQDPLHRWLVGPLLLVFRVQTGECGLIVLKRPPKDKLHDRQHADTESQQVREALDLVVDLDKQRRDMDAALAAVEDAFDTVCVAVAQDRLLQRQPLLHRVGDKGLPAEPLDEIGDGVALAGDVGD